LREFGERRLKRKNLKRFKKEFLLVLLVREMILLTRLMKMLQFTRVCKKLIRLMESNLYYKGKRI
jgi:hypothetical protein